MSSVAVIGASEHNLWFRNFKRNLVLYGYSGNICPVNPRSPVVEGVRSYPSLGAIEDNLDAVVVAVAASRCPDAVRAAVEMGAKDIVVVAAGFAEVGSSSGDELQARLAAACAPETRLYGPNCVGFADFANNLCLIGEPILPCNKPGRISIISQSGALLATIMAAVIEDAGGVDWCASLGNAARFDMAMAIDHILGRGTTRVIAIYAEMLGAEPSRLGAALRRAADANVAVVMIKAGRSAVGERIAYSHTASVAGDDAEVDAYLRAHGVIRVDSLEELARVSVMAAMRRSGRGPGVAIIGSSGGQAAVAGELAARDRLRLADLSDQTRAFLTSRTAPGSFIENPLDLTGGSGLDEDLFGAVYGDEGVGFVLSPWSITFPDDSPEHSHNRPIVELAVRAAHETDTPTVISSLVTVPWTEWILKIRADNPDVLIVRGIETTIRALSRLFPDDRCRSREPEAGSAGEIPPTVIGEGTGREVLNELGLDLPIVAGERCSDVETAVAAATRIGWPVVVKLDVVGVAHKARLGLVTIGCRNAAEIEAAIERSTRSLIAHGYTVQDLAGILVERLATGVEVLLGLHWSELGRFLTIGTGGIGAREGSSAETYLLPVSEETLISTISRMSGLPSTSRGCRATAHAVAELSAAFKFGALSTFSVVEVNPVLISEDECTFVDVLLIPS